MKYLKTYENLVHKIGDYVVTYNKFGQIVNVIDKKFSGGVRIPSYLIHIFNGDYNISCRKKEIRKATEEEIENFKMKQNANKYNL
jgi:hypothetical protein